MQLGLRACGFGICGWIFFGLVSRIGWDLSLEILWGIFEDRKGVFWGGMFGFLDGCDIIRVLRYGTFYL